MNIAYEIRHHTNTRNISFSLWTNSIYKAFSITVPHYSTTLICRNNPTTNKQLCLITVCHINKENDLEINDIWFLFLWLIIIKTTCKKNKQKFFDTSSSKWQLYKLCWFLNLHSGIINHPSAQNDMTLFHPLYKTENDIICKMFNMILLNNTVAF